MKIFLQRYLLLNVGRTMIDMPKIAIIMGSYSDFPVVKSTILTLKNFGIDTDVKILSAHRTPEEASQYAKSAADNGVEVIIAAAGKAAHLPGVLAAYTNLPVIGLPIKSSTMDGLDSLLSIVQMPTGIPVATVAINGGENAALLAIQILALKHQKLGDVLKDYRENMKKQILSQNEAIQGEVDQI